MTVYHVFLIFGLYCGEFVIFNGEIVIFLAAKMSMSILGISGEFVIFSGEFVIFNGEIVIKLAARF